MFYFWTDLSAVETGNPLRDGCYTEPMNVVLVGHVCVDSNTSERSSYTGWGSSLMYMAAYFRDYTDIHPVLIAPHGTDFQEYAEGLDLLPAAQGEHTLLYKNVTRNNHRTQWCGSLGAAHPVPITDEVKNCITAADVIIVAPLLPNYTVEYVEKLLAAKKPGCLTALLPQGFLRVIGTGGKVLPREFEEANDVLSLFDLVILSDDDVNGDVQKVQSWAKQNLRTNIIMTQGALGASWVTSKGLVSVKTKPIPREQIVDSVGCGDTFSAAAVLSYFVAPDVTAAVQAGNEAAGAKLRQKNQNTTISFYQSVS